MECDYFKEGLCGSCSEITLPYEEQLKHKEAALLALLEPCGVTRIDAVHASRESAFRNKAKMVALGFAHEPKLGIVSPSGEEVSLTLCPLYTPAMQQLLGGIESWIKIAGLPPYKVERKRGELKFVLVYESPQSGRFMVRFVLASHKRLESIKSNLPQLLERHPEIEAVSANIQPVHMARLEGDEEIFLTPSQVLPLKVGDVTLFMRAKSFMQTNLEVAGALYRRAGEIAGESGAKEVVDLFCGLGGFGLHAAKGGRALTGIEIESYAIESARRSAKECGIESVHFSPLSADGAELRKEGRLLIVNPPRRGLGKALSEQINESDIASVIYSSCNAQTLAEDLKYLSRYRVVSTELFDMFPHTQHYETLCYLQLKSF